MSSSESKLVVPTICERSSIPELISFVRSSFRQEEYDEVERLLIFGEEKLKTELRSLKRDYESMKKDRDLLEEKYGLVELENLEIKEELEKLKFECEELKREKRATEKMVAHRDSQLMDLDIRVSSLEEAVAHLLRVDVVVIRSGACRLGERKDVEFLVNGVKVPVSEGKNEGLNMETLQNGVNDDVKGEYGGIGLETTGTQGPNLLVEDLKDKELLKTKVGMMNRHNVVPNSQNVQDACDAPQVGIFGFSEEKENKVPIKAALASTECACDNEMDVHSTSLAAAACIPASKTPGSLIVVEVSDSDEESLPAESANLSVFCAAEVGSTGKEMPCINSEKSACSVKIQEENGSDSTKDSRIHLLPKRKRSMTESNGTNFMVARRKTEYTGKLLNNGKGSLANDRSMTLGLKSIGSQELILPKAGADGSLQVTSRKLLLDDSDSDSDSDDEPCSDSYLEHMLASLQRDREKKRKFAADVLSAFDKDYELCMNAVCALYRKKISAEKSLMKSSLHADPVFSHFDAMSGKQLAEFLIDGDPQYRLKRSVSEVQQKDPKVLSKCKDLAIQYRDKLFEIYHKAEDPFFRPRYLPIIDLCLCLLHLSSLAPPIPSLKCLLESEIRRGC